MDGRMMIKHRSTPHPSASSTPPPVTLPPPARIAWPGREPEAGQRRGAADPLLIAYVLVMDPEREDRMTPFQGLGRGWRHLRWALSLLAEMPANVLEQTWPLEPLIAQRMGGGNHQNWMPLMVEALQRLRLDEIGFSTVLFTGAPGAARGASAWATAQRRPVLHVSTENVSGAVPVDQFDLERLRVHCEDVFRAHSDELSPERAAAALDAIGRWAARTPIPVALDELGHNCVTPNHMVLRRAGRSLGEPHPHWMSQHEDDYTRAVVESAEAVLEVRRQVGSRTFNRLYIPQPGMVLTEPAMYRHAYRPLPPELELDPASRMMIRRMQRQTGLSQQIDREDMAKLAAGGEWMAPLSLRAEEAAGQTSAVGLMAAQSCAAVVRLRPAVNHVFPRLSEFARNMRAEGKQAARKSGQLLRRVQDELARAVGPERLDLIARTDVPIKIVADAPLELLPLDGLPLAMRRDVSRINATPGNLMMGELVGREQITVLHHQLDEILVVSTFGEDDDLRDLMEEALRALEADAPGRFRIAFHRVRTVDEFVDVVNASTASIMIFDGHGRQDDVGGLEIGGRPVDIWSLRPRLNVPPIVILSSCDTHGIDAPTHATAGNSFVAVGAVAVLATLLPVGGQEAATFIRRLLNHIAEFVPAAIGTRGRALSWTEVMGGVLRLTLVNDMLKHMVRIRVIDEEVARGEFRTVMECLVRGEADWFDGLRARLADRLGPEARSLREHIQQAIARSESIRYIQLGAPERITVASSELVSAIVPWALPDEPVMLADDGGTHAADRSSADGPDGG